jgi:hypothetical protein
LIFFSLLCFPGFEACREGILRRDM